ncbi:MAG: hypothetical protein IPG89_21620 [Bacteroidetes bacterium]|nr:hypothetical protein [Bacteroidota bacterium]
MITINRDAINIVVLTLSEKTTIEDATYLFTFTNDQSNKVKSFIAIDISPNPIRYNRFDIIEDNTEDLENGVVKLDQLDSWSYTIREQASATNLVVVNSGNIVEEGIVIVLDSSTEIPTFTDETTEIKVFNG